MAGTIVSNAVQLGDSGTATNNLTLRTNANGTFTIARGNVGATTQDILTIDSNGRVSQGVAQSFVRLLGANGYGSSSTVTRRFTTVVTNQGADITYADSSTNGGTFTIVNTGLYAITYVDQFSAATTGGISLNASSGATAILSLTASQILSSCTSAAANFVTCTSWTGYLNAGDVVRAHMQAATSAGTNTAAVTFTITRIA